jgi:apolipoprotein D and lipocalin family protein
MKNILIICAFLGFSTMACASTKGHEPLRVEQNVDIQKYMGLWYEIERYDVRFERGCGNVTAEYSLTKKGKVKVLKTCTKRKKNGKLKTKDAKGLAFVVDRKTNASLKVSFVPFFKWLGWFAGDYNIIKLGDNYEYVLVGSQDRNYLWILSRTPTLSEDIKDMLKAEARSQGFDITKLIITPSF